MKGKFRKIILFGSYARDDDWIDESENGYQSDCDVLSNDC